MSVDDIYFKLRPPAPTPKDELCVCTGGKPIKLMCALSFNPVHCIDCNLEVRPEVLGSNGALAETIAFWRNVYDAIDHLWLDSREYEMWAKSELEDISSPVNQRGLGVVAALNDVRRCYYWLFQDQSVPGFKPIRECPKCDHPFRRYDGGIFLQAICDPCSIITVAG